jgi:hypothetical protein
MRASADGLWWPRLMDFMYCWRGWECYLGKSSGILLAWMLVVGFSPLAWFHLVHGAGRLNPVAGWVIRQFGRGVAWPVSPRGRVAAHLQLTSQKLFGKQFEELDEAQKAEDERVYRAWMQGEKPPELGAMASGGLIDERLVQEENRMNAISLGAVTWALYASFLCWILQPDTANLSGRWVWMWLASMHVLASTLPRTIVLWTEPDPRDTGDLMLAELGPLR